MWFVDNFIKEKDVCFDLVDLLIGLFYYIYTKDCIISAMCCHSE